jgi:hypothetical protein
MFSPGLSVREQLAQLDDVLGLNGDVQDWGIENADSERVAEFVSFFEQHQVAQWAPITVGAFFDLVMESACDALRREPDYPVSVVDPFVAHASPMVPGRVTDWTAHDWRIAPHLRALALQ